MISCLDGGDHINDLIGREEVPDKCFGPPETPLAETRFLSCVASYWGRGLAAGGWSESLPSMSNQKIMATSIKCPALDIWTNLCLPGRPVT